MGIRIRPREIEIPEGDPFCNDLLDRKEHVEILTHLVGSIKGPCVLAVDAAWGNGKSTFLRLWSRHLKDEQFPIVEFNAWETDFSADPFVALSTELTDGFQKHSGRSTQKVLDSWQKSAGEVARMALSGVIRSATGGILNIEPLLEDKTKVDDRLSAYRKAKESVDDFKKKLQDMATTVSKECGDKPMIVMIDELDRCRPSYAVEFLEVAKHLFSVDRIVFVLAINRSELSHSVKVLYGHEFDANGYLKRFIDVDFRLPSPDRDKFISDLLERTDIGKYFERTKDKRARGYGFLTVEEMLKKLFGAFELNFRQISQAVHRIGLVLASLRSDRLALAEVTVAALILRTINERLYHKFVSGEATDLKVVDTLFPDKEGVLLNDDDRCLFEAAVMVGYQEISRGGAHTPLWKQYNQAMVSAESATDVEGKYSQHAKKVIENVLELCKLPELLRSGGSSIKFSLAIHRIELLSGELMGDPPSETEAPTQ